MSNRFHNKFHRHNHHTRSTEGYPDSSFDPIASRTSPFQGEFYIDGDVTTLSSVSAQGDLFARNGTIHNDLTVRGNFTVLGTTSQLDTLVYASSAVEITNVGTGPALKVTQTGSEPIAHFIDSNGDDIIFADNGYVGLGTFSPTEKLDVIGNVKTTGTATIGTIATGATDSVIIESSGLVQKRNINPQVWDTTAKFVSASDGVLSVNRLTKAENGNGINESIVFDDGTNVGIGTDNPNEKLTISGNLSSSGTATIGTVPTNSTGNSFIVETNGLLQKRILNIGALDTTAVFVSASDGALTVNRLPKATDSNGINESIVFDDGTNVGIGTDNPGAKLTVSGTLSTLGTATIGTIATNSTETSFVVETNGLLQKRSLNTAATDTTSRFVSASDGALSVNYLPKATNSNGINESIIYDDGTNVGIGETAPEGKLHVKAGSSGSVTAQPNSIGIFENSSNSYISVLSPTSQYAGLVMGGPGNPYGAYVSWNHDNSALKVSTAHTGGAIQLLVNAEQEAVRILSGGNVGIGTINPKEKLTISGNLSSSGTATIGTIATNDANTSFVVESNGLLQKRALNIAAGNTTATFVSASDGALTVNYLTKATNSNGINESIISDNGSLVYVGGNLTISGNLTALGNSYFANTLFTTTSSISVVNNGPGPAMYVYQGPGTSDVASFYDGDGVEVLHIGNCDPGQQLGKIGVNESDPNKELTVRGSVSASGTLNLGTINTNATSDSIVVLGTGNILEKRSIDSRTWGSSLVDGTGTTNYVTKWSDSNTVTNSIVFDNGTNVGIGTTSPSEKLDISGNLKTSGTATIGNIATGTGSSFVIESSGLLQKRSLNTAAVDTTSVFVSASDGALTVNRLTKATNSNGINESIVTDDGSLVSVGGNLSTTGTATIGNIATGTTNSVIIESLGTLQKRSIDSRAWGSSLVDGTGTTNYVAKWSDADTITNSIVFDNGTNVGIGTASPSVKLDVNGVIRSNNEIIGSALGGSGQARYISGNFGIIHRNDGSDYYILKTASGDQYGGWDTSRPFVVNLATGNVGIGSAADSLHKLSVTGNIKSTNVIIPGSSTVTPAATTALPSSNDVILNNQTGPVTITAFSGGVAGVTYTITNKSTHAVTLDTSASLFVRGGNSWASHKCTTNAEGYIVLPQNFSCSLRMDSDSSGSAW